MVKKLFIALIVLATLFLCAGAKHVGSVRPRISKISTEFAYIAVRFNEGLPVINLTTVTEKSVTAFALDKSIIELNKPNELYLFKLPAGEYYFWLFRTDEGYSKDSSIHHSFYPVIFDKRIKVSVRSGSIVYLGDFLIDKRTSFRRGFKSLLKYDYNFDQVEMGLINKYGEIIQGFEIKSHFEEKDLEDFEMEIRK